MNELTEAGPTTAKPHRRKPTRLSSMLRSAAWVALPVTMFVVLIIPGLMKVRLKMNQAAAVNHCRQIIISMRLSANEDNSYQDADRYGRPRYLPPLSTSNDVFREMFREGSVTDESIFGCPMSVFQPDGKTGPSPNFPDAVGPGENHWAMTYGLTDSSPSSFPLIYENPAEATWPPRWRCNPKGNSEPGRAWPDGKVIIGMNDGSVTSAKILPALEGELAGLEPYFPMSDKNQFSQNTLSPDGPQFGILNVALPVKNPTSAAK